MKFHVPSFLIGAGTTIVVAYAIYWKLIGEGLAAFGYHG